MALLHSRWNKVLLFGPFAAFTSKFLKNGSLLDLLRAGSGNISPMIQTDTDGFE